MKTVLFFIAWKGRPELFGIKMCSCSFAAWFLGDEGRGAQCLIPVIGICGRETMCKTF